jgi:hypothetical protein
MEFIAARPERHQKRNGGCHPKCPDSKQDNPQTCGVGAESSGGGADAEQARDSMQPGLEAQITELVGHLNSANHRLLLLIAEFDRRKGWAHSATQSCAHWLHWKCGIDMGAAREKVRVARALTELPKVSAAMARGELSYSKVRAITRVARPETEEVLLSIALHGTTHHVETTVRWFRRAQQAEELSREARQQAGRRVTFAYDEDGSLIMKASLPAEAGALLLKALDAAIDDVERPADVSGETSGDGAAGKDGSAGKDDPTPGERPARSVRRADALTRLAESFLAHGAKALKSGERNHLVVHVDEQSLRECSAGRCETEDGPTIPVETARRLGCDASTVSITEDEDGSPLNVGRKTRTIPPAIARALRSRDRCCRFPGCHNKHYVDGHHIRHWVDGGETRLSNLVLLCTFHHRQVHEGGVQVEVLEGGTLRFVMPDGRAFDSPVPSRPGEEKGPPAEDILHGNWSDLPTTADEEDLEITPETATTRWRGESMDYSTAVQSLMFRARQLAARTVGAGSSR